MIVAPVEHFLNGKVALHAGDCLTVLAQLDECSVDSCVTDPPYHLTSIVKRFGGENAAPAQFGTDGAYKRASAGFMGKQWDGGDVAFRPETWAEVYRVLKPGGYLLAFGGTRTYHRLACAIEDAGFEVRDMVSWIYGSGFPKSHDVSKAIDSTALTGKSDYSSMADVEDAKGAGLGKQDNSFISYGGDNSRQGKLRHGARRSKTEPATDAAREWSGWGTALKPALEPICMARKTLSEGTVAANVLEWGTGAINVDGCRVPAEDKTPFPVGATSADGSIKTGLHSKPRGDDTNKSGRWPANVIHDGSEEVVGMFPETHSAGSERPHTPGGSYDGNTGIGMSLGIGQKGFRIGDAGGSAARFYYTAKADSDDRIGSSHPTVKPVDLMQYLVRLVTPKNGVCLDPFAGTGTTGEAAFREGFRAILIEAEAEYQADIRRRIALVLAGPDERVRESVKARGTPIDYGPLFSGIMREAAE